MCFFLYLRELCFSFSLSSISSVDCRAEKPKVIDCLGLLLSHGLKPGATRNRNIDDDELYFGLMFLFLLRTYY